MNQNYAPPNIFASPYKGLSYETLITGFPELAISINRHFASDVIDAVNSKNFSKLAENYGLNKKYANLVYNDYYKFIDGTEFDKCYPVMQLYDSKLKMPDFLKQPIIEVKGKLFEHFLRTAYSKSSIERCIMLEKAVRAKEIGKIDGVVDVTKY